MGYETFDSWVNKNLGKSLDPDRVFGVQCVDLIKSYCVDVIRINKPYTHSWGNAIDFYTKFDSKPWLVSNFDKIPNTPDFVPKKGDIGVFRSLSPKGHIVVCNGVGDSNTFNAYDQNYNGTHAGMTLRTFKYSGSRKLLGVLRPKDQTNIGSTSNYVYVTYSNGRTPELVYDTSYKHERIGSLDRKEQCWCYGKRDGMYIVGYYVNGKEYAKAGFVGYSGKVKYIPQPSQTYTNGNSRKIVYEDSTCAVKAIGYLNPNEQAVCLDRYKSGAYLILYKTKHGYKVGFVR